jgi:predicted Zn-ribbon and HTH transcriptional regulator
MKKNEGRTFDFLECKRCGWKWIPRNKEQKPIICPKCKNPYWNKEKRIK